MDWMISGLRWLSCCLPKQLISEGAMSHARVRIGLTIFQLIFKKLTSSFTTLKSDFHKWTTVIFDGSTGTTPDTESNRDKFGKSKCGRGESAFPMLRIVTLISASTRLILDFTYGSSQGKGTGERTLMTKLLAQFNQKNLLFVLDAGLYSFATIFSIRTKECDFLLRVASNIKLPVISDSRLPDGYMARYPDGSYLSEINGKILNLEKSTESHKQWNHESIIVRVIEYQIPGFLPRRLVTSIIDPNISAKELIIHYHCRWEVEISFCEIKTHQCATLKGQMPTIFRSKTSELVEQELYAMLIAYNLLRDLIYQSANEYDKNPLLLSFLESLQLVIDLVQLISHSSLKLREIQHQYLLSLISQSEIDRPRRKRINPRVVKIKMSKFKRKNSSHKSEIRDIEKDLKILPPQAV
ncbi:IS4 family transposase [Anabaena cylindrica UHCC 0172]|uniref:IS4 family transposase n=1 Tax=Anabaena cylindrica TaxID=1165 RepID=UPI002B213AD1|nr:IS4 family transposase [Anabaena cylindrica]MEA5551629.1 IS4 family transposase [Anabaena cylindrica UHCC 0172]